MKKIDLHIHTIKTVSDPAFDFSLETFQRYVTEAKLDAVAVTNHNVFSLEQYRKIAAALSVVVFPGIEVDVDNGHLLVFADPDNVEDFAIRAAQIEKKIPAESHRVSVEEFVQIFGDLSKYLLIPHFEKHPPLSPEALGKLRPHLAAGEVDSPKKFIRLFKDNRKLTPVIFSDSRMKVDMKHLPIRQTYVDCSDVTLGSLKLCLQERKVALSESDGNRLWQALPDGLLLSTGLNVLLGARSSGKSHTLDLLFENNQNVKYIKQFELVQHSDVEDEKQFKGDLEKRGSTFSEKHLADLKTVVEAMLDVDSLSNTRVVERYVASLLKAAADIDMEDSFSNATLFKEAEFPLSKTETLETLVRSVQQIIENLDYKDIIARHLQRTALIGLICELIEVLHQLIYENSVKAYVNGIVKEVKRALSFHTSATAVEDIDLYEICLDDRKVTRFNELVTYLKTEKVIQDERVQGFRNEVTRKPFTGAGEVRAAAAKLPALSGAFSKYDNPYEYLCELRKLDSIPRGDLYKLFVKIHYRILNGDGLEVSGGERSEFRLLHQIQDSQNYDLLLIDEPESSFDNIFLRSDVNHLLKQIAAQMPVVVVTHNSTVGASVLADYLLFSAKEKTDTGVAFKVYSGFPSSRLLKCADGTEILNHNVLLDSLEAGVDAYEGRKAIYEAVKNLR